MADEKVVDIKTGKPKPPPKPKKVRVIREPTKTALELVREDPKDKASAVRGLFIRSRWDGDDETEVLDQVTDCELEVDCVVDVDGVREFSVHVVRGSEPRGPPRRLKMDTLENERRLNAWASDAGCCWNLDDDLRWEVKKYLHAQPGARRLVFTPTTVGWNAEFGVWLLQGMVIGADGVDHPHTPGDRSGPVLCSDGATREFIVAPHAPEAVPPAPPGATAAEWDHMCGQSREDLKWYLFNHRENYGHHAGAFAVGWMVAGLRRDAIMKRFLSFPIFYIFAAAEEGKNTFGDLMMEVAGVKTGAIKVGHGGSVVGVRDEAAKICNLPMWVDELRNDDECARYAGWMRGVFDGSVLPIKGKDYKPMRPLIASGQNLFGSTAEHLRYISIRLEKRTITRSAYTLVRQAAPGANLAFTRLMALSTQEWWTTALLWAIDANRQLLYKAAAVADTVVKDRQVFCWAVALAGLMLALHPDPMQFTGGIEDHGIFDQSVVDECVARMLATSKSAREMSAVGKFWELCEQLDIKGVLANVRESTWCKVVRHENEDCVAVSIAYLFHVASGYPAFRAMSPDTLREELTAHQDYRGTGDAYMGGRSKKVIFYTMATDNLPRWMIQKAAFARNVIETGGDDER